MNTTNWKGAYGYEVRHSMYSYEHHPRKTETDVGVGTRQQTLKRCGIVKPSAEQLRKQDPAASFSGCCPWR
jgi:hypothetical protein